jgi:uncharacterized oxidoreductase
MKISGNTILVTGGTSGIGRALAVALHSRGNRVIVAGRRQDLLDEIASEYPGMIGLQLDQNDAEAVSCFANDIRMQFPDLNVLVVNAGIAIEEDLIDAWDWTATEATIETNILGTLRVIAALLPNLKLQPDAVIMATLSNVAFVPRASFPTYCASKAFLHSWLQSLRHQLRDVPVEVLELVPPYVQTELSGPQQACDPHGMPLAEYITEVMGLLENRDHARGEILVERARDARSAERDGRYESIFVLMNPA